MKNQLISLIEEGRIRSEDDLKTVYRGLLKKTHPDTAGTDSHIDAFLELKQCYRDALTFLHHSAETTVLQQNHRFFFYYNLFKFNLSSYSGGTEEIPLRADLLKEIEYLGDFLYHADCSFPKALFEWRSILSQRKKNDLKSLRKTLLKNDIRPFFHDLCCYQLTGRSYFLRQLNRIAEDVLQRSRRDGYPHFSDFLEFLLNDGTSDPAVWKG